jgi:FMN-dependent NADH-azoreductase
MYNFTVPSQLKAWIDGSPLPARPFRYAESGPEGLLKGKKAFIASARGGVYSPGPPAAVLRHHERYLTGVLAFFGISMWPAPRVSRSARKRARRRSPTRARKSRPSLPEPTAPLAVNG